MSKALAAASDAQSARAVLSHERSVVRLLSLLIAMAALGYYASRGYLLLYGDAVAHLHIARRIFDSLNPGFRQLGSVWLPLPHILLIPFVLKMKWWQNGMAGAVPSIVSYIAGCVGIFRLARHWLPLPAAIMAVLFYALNPGLIYLSTTAMTEPLYLALMVWSVVFLVEISAAMQDASETAQARAAQLLRYLAFVLVAAVFTRYDGWIYAALSWLAATFIVISKRRWQSPATGAWLLMTVMIAIAPFLWIVYNAKQFHDPFDFLRGPYSAKAIELRTTPPGAAHYPGWHNLRISSTYFLKTAQLDAAWPWAGRVLVFIAFCGSLVALLRFRSTWTALLFWLPYPFYAYSVAYGSVPIFIPVWLPYSFYNTRYGMELLPAFALFTAFAIGELIAALPKQRKWIPVAAGALIAANSAAMMHAKPLVLQEAIANGHSRIAFEHALAIKLADIPSSEQMLMYTSAHVGALQQAGIPLKRTINEGDYYQWGSALEHPASAAPWIIAIDGDPLASAIKLHPENLDLLSVTCASDQGCARIYHARESQR